MPVNLKPQTLRKAPWRGIYQAIADEKDVTLSYVTQAIWVHMIPEYIEALARHIKKRKKVPGVPKAAKILNSK